MDLFQSILITASTIPGQNTNKVSVQLFAKYMNHREHNVRMQYNQPDEFLWCYRMFMFTRGESSNDTKSKKYVIITLYFNHIFDSNNFA